jgi:hypothetical protein
MPITTIQNATGAVLTLLDVNTQVANLAAGAAVQNAPITITRITCAGISLPNKQGGFLNGVSYAATLAGGIVTFTGPANVVTFRAPANVAKTRRPPGRRSS